MKFTIAAFVALAASFAAALPTENDTMMKVRSLQKRHFGEVGSAGRLSKRQSANLTDADIFNFALHLEYLEAQYYHIAAFGTQLDQSLLTGTGTQGQVQTSQTSAVPFSSNVTKAYAEEIALDELNHVKAIRATLGSSANAMPTINLNESFTAAAQAAGIIQSNETFNPFESDATFLLGAFLFEDVGVTAYSGAAPLISDKTFLAAAAGILAVEAYHASAIRYALLTAGQTTPAYITDANEAAAAEGSLGGGKSEGITVDGNINLVPADSNSIAYARTPSEVLGIAFLGGSTMGGFFPDGINLPLSSNAAPAASGSSSAASASASA